MKRSIALFLTTTTLLLAQTGHSLTPTEVAELLASDGQFSDRFGFSVALNGNTALIGAWLDDDNVGGAGAAYIYTFDGTSWSGKQKLTASDGAAGDFFGGPAGDST